MLGKSLLAASAAISLVSAAAVPRSASGTSYQTVVYWGQNDSEQELDVYCQSNEGIDVLVLAFLANYGNGNGASGSFGTCSGDHTCTKLESHVQTCKSMGKKILVSLGGEGSPGELTSQSDAENVAQSIWDSFGNPAFQSNQNAVRPMGSQFVDGFDIDVESNPNGNTNYKYLVNKLRSLFGQDGSNQYLITGAPQCPLPEDNMGDMIMGSQFDYLFIQFYNNDPCSANSYADGDKSDFNFDDWKSYIGGGSSSNAQLFIGIPAGVDGATGDSSGAKYYLQPSQMASLVNDYKSHAGFAGVMLWDAGNSDTVNDNGCTYSEEVSSVLKTGNTC